MYGLRRAPRAWFNRFADFVVKLGFRATRFDSSLFVLQRGHDIAYLLLYVDDIVLTGSSPVLLQNIVERLRAEFAVKDMGDSASSSASTSSEHRPSSFSPRNATPRTSWNALV